MATKAHILTYQEVKDLHTLLSTVLRDPAGNVYPVRIELERSYLTFHVPSLPTIEMILDLKKN